MERLERMKECLIDVVEGQIHSNLEKVDTKELGEAIDMIKDLAEAIYYCTITEAMEEDKEEQYYKGTMYYSPKKVYSGYLEHDPYDKERHPLRDKADMMNRRPAHDRVHYPESVDHIYRDGVMKDPNEGKSGERRKMYMDGKGVRDKTQQMKELDNYMQELTSDITEMIMDASPEEKQLL